MRVKVNKKYASLIGLLFGILVLVGAILLIQTNKNPLPTALKNEVSFKVVYPSARIAAIDSSSYKYLSSRGTLSFTTSYLRVVIAFTEQPAPSSLGSDTQIYYPALGIHPYAQFQTKLGPVALTKFWQSGSLQPVGQAAVLASHGTLTIAHSDKTLTNQQWKNLFDNLKITK